jgi:excisionase family DNA binding protein
MITASELATRLGVSRGRVSQMVAEGKLDGCFKGEGRARRFDPQLAAAALNQRLDIGQQVGNGAQARAARAALSRPAGVATEGLLPPTDDDNYKLYRTEKAREEAIRLRRQNRLEEGTAVLAAEAARETARALQAELTAVDAWVSTLARTLADTAGIDYLEARATIRASWRDHREKRAAALRIQADTATPTDAEAEADL